MTDESIWIPQIQPWLGEEEAAAAAQAVLSNWISEGPRCREFSEQLCELISVPHGVFAPNGTLALALALMALDIGPGDEVLVPATTFIGSANAAILVGASPIFVDVDINNFQIDLACAERLVTPRTRAIMPVHLYGTSCDMLAVMSFAARHSLKVVEDAAQGIGVMHRGRHVGSFGDASAFSFFADKTITTGEGGFVVCRDDGTNERLRHLRNQGRLNSGSFIHPTIGYNFRITDIQAAIGLVQLSKLHEIVARKRTIYGWYLELLNNVRGVRVLGAAPESTHVPFRCVLIAPRAQTLIAHLAGRGIQSRGFFNPMHRQPCFVAWFADKPHSPPMRDEDYPNAVFGYENGLCLPMFPALRQAQVEYIVAQIADFYA